MKRINIILLISFACISMFLLSCSKEAPNIFNMFDVTLDLQIDKTPRNDGLIEIAADDSITVNYTIECPSEEIYGVALFKAGQSGGTVTNVKPAHKISGSYKLYGKDLGVGLTTYRIWAVNRAAIYLGDGYKRINIMVKSEFNYFTNRFVYAADTAGKRESFLSLSNGNSYSYQNGAAKSDSIDLGFYMSRKDTVVKIDNKDSLVVYYPLIVYSLAANPSPNKIYDLSAWTKRGTVFSPVEDGTEEKFRNNFNTVAKIIAEAKKKTFSSLIQTGYDKRVEGDRNNVFTGKFVFFKTPEDKYGVILFNVAKKDQFNRVFTNVSWKAQP